MSKTFYIFPRQNELKGSGFKKKLQKNFRGPQTAWNSFQKPAINVAASFIGMKVGAKSKNLKAGQSTTIFL